MKNTMAIQYTDTTKTEQEAVEMFAFLMEQVDYIAGHIIEPAGKGWWAVTEPEQVWKVQVFFEDAPDATWLPDGCRRVILTDSLLKGMVAR